jgi:hypothetical protein
MLGAVGEDPGDVGAAADLAVEPLGYGVVGPDLAPDFLREAGEGEDVGTGFLEMPSDRGGLLGQGVDDPVELGAVVEVGRLSCTPCSGMSPQRSRTTSKTSDGR